MAIDKYTDAINRTSKTVTKVVKESEKECEFCGSLNCGGHDHTGKKKDIQMMQSVRENPNIDWRQQLGHPDDFTLKDFHQRMGATHQVIRDNPVIKGSVKNERAHTIGFKVRLTYQPDYEALGQDIKWQMQTAAVVEDLWERDMEDPVYCWNDSQRCQTFSGQMGLAFMESQGSGEIFGLFYEDKSENDHHMPFNMRFGLIDVSRLSTPFSKRGKTNNIIVEGKRMTKQGMTMGYYVSDELKNMGCHNRFTQMAMNRNKLKWNYIPRFTEWNSPQAVHWFDKERAGQNRAMPDLSSALKRTHMLESYEETVLDAATRDAAFAMWVESDMPNVAQAFNTNPGMSPGEFVQEVLGAQQEAISDFYSDHKIELKAGKGVLPHLLPTERVRNVSPGSPNDQHVNFDRSMSTAIGRALGVDPYTFTGDMTNVNYSTIRAALIQTWVNRYWKRDSIFTYIGTPIFTVWMEEKIARGEIRMPISSNRTLSHLNYFYKNRRALTMLEFCGPGQEPIDQVKWFRAQDGAIDSGLQTKSRFYKKYTDTTFRKAVTQLKYEQELLRENGLDEFVAGEKPQPSIGTAMNDRVDDNASRGDGTEENN